MPMQHHRWIQSRRPTPGCRRRCWPGVGCPDSVSIMCKARRALRPPGRSLSQIKLGFESALASMRRLSGRHPSPATRIRRRRRWWVSKLRKETPARRNASRSYRCRPRREPPVGIVDSPCGQRIYRVDPRQRQGLQQSAAAAFVKIHPRHAAGCSKGFEARPIDSDCKRGDSFEASRKPRARRKSRKQRVDFSGHLMRDYRRAPRHRPALPSLSPAIRIAVVSTLHRKPSLRSRPELQQLR